MQEDLGSIQAKQCEQVVDQGQRLLVAEVLCRQDEVGLFPGGGRVSADEEFLQFLVLFTGLDLADDSKSSGASISGTFHWS